MIKSFIHNFCKTVLNELFINSSSESVELSMGSDLFAESNINLKNLTFRSDIFEAILQPFHLVSGHLGKLTIEGIAELALGGKIRCQVENIFLLFAVNTTLDAEEAQYLKKLIVELQTKNLQHFLVRELLKRIQGFAEEKYPDLKKKRLLILRILKYVFNSVQIFIKTVHIRIEIPCRGFKENTTPYCSAIGLTIPYLKLSPGAGTKVEGVSKEEKYLILKSKNLQIYCDYNCESYLSNGKQAIDVWNVFLERWKSEVHTAILLPTDFDLVLVAEVIRKCGLLSSKFIFSIQKLRFAIDTKQLDVLKSLLVLITEAKIRMNSLLRLKATYGNPDCVYESKQSPDRTPQLVGIGGSHVLPRLNSNTIITYTTPTSKTAMNSKTILAAQALPPIITTVYKHQRTTLSTVRLLQRSYPFTWTRVLWKHAIEMVIADIRTAKPLGRWLQLVELIRIRKDYAFTYSQFLRRSKVTGFFVYNINYQHPDYYKLLNKLFRYEMICSVKNILEFRSLAHMVATVELFNGKRKAMVINNLLQQHGGIRSIQAARFANYISEHFEHTSIAWRDVLRIHIELTESLRESAYTRRKELILAEDEAEDDVDDNRSDVSGMTTASVGSIYSHSTGTYQQVPRSAPLAAFNVEQAFQSPSSKSSSDREHSSSASKVLRSMFGFSPTAALSHRNGANAPSASSAAAVGTGAGSHIGKLINNMTNLTTGSNGPSDDLEMRLFGKEGILALKHVLGKSEEEEWAQELVRESDPPAVALPEGFEEPAYEDEGHSPSIGDIVEACNWVLIRHQQALAIKHPDLTVQIAATEFMYKLPLSDNHRKSIVSISIADISAVTTISSSTITHKDPFYETSPNTAASNNLSSIEHQVKCLPGGMTSLSGSLVQFRFTIQKCKVQLYVYNKQRVARLNGCGGGEPHKAASKRSKTSDALLKGLQKASLKNTSSSRLSEEEVDVKITADEDYDNGDNDYNGYEETPPRMRGVAIPSWSDPATPDSVGGDYDGRGAASVLGLIGETGNKSVSTVLEALKVKGELDVMAAAEKLKQEEELRVKELEPLLFTVFQSEDKDVALIVCLVLDLDRHCDGAVDLQGQLGAATLDIGGELLAAAMDQEATDQLQRSQRILNEISRIRAVGRLNDTYGLLDLTDGVTAVSRVFTARYKQEYASDGRMKTPEKTLPTGSSDTIPLQVIQEHVNYQKCLSLFKSIVPKVFSLIFRTSSLTVLALNATSLANLIESQVERRAKKASYVRTSNSTPVLSPGVVGTVTLSLLKMLRDMEGAVSSPVAPADPSLLRPKCLVPPLEIAVRKGPDPSPFFELRLCGLEIRVPIAELALCQALAMLWANSMPVHT